MASPCHAVRGPSPNPSQSGSLGDYNSTGYLKTDDVVSNTCMYGNDEHSNSNVTYVMYMYMNMCITICM